MTPPGAWDDDLLTAQESLRRAGVQDGGERKSHRDVKHAERRSRWL